LVRGRTPKPVEDTCSPGICQAGSGLTSRRRDRSSRRSPSVGALQRGQPVLGPVALSDRDGPVERHDRVDQVRRVVPHLRRLADRGLRQRPGPPHVIGHALPLAHLAAVPLSGPCRPVAGLGLWGQPEAVPHVIGYGLGDLLARAEPRHLLEALQVDHQRQQRLRRLGALPCPGSLVLGRGEEHVQHPCRGQPPELRIGSALDRRQPTGPLQPR
jgi:hypothetical protein